MTSMLILPGLNGSEPGHWQTYWKADNPGSSIVEQHNWDRPELDAWLGQLEKVLSAEKDVILVAHSLGCLLAAHLAGSPVAQNVRGALLVAPCNLAQAEQMHPGAISFGTMPVDRLPFPSLFVASLNDPYMPFSESRRFAAHWGSNLIDLGYAGHINVASGFGRWKEGYKLPALFDHEKRKDSVGSYPGMASRQTFRGLVRERRLVP